MFNITIGDRVTILSKNVTGEVAFIGNTYFAEGIWYGIILDKPKGRNNGSVEGMHYFDCPPNHGLFVREHQLTKHEVGLNVLLNTLKRSHSDQNIAISTKKIDSELQIISLNAVVSDQKTIVAKQNEELITAHEYAQELKKRLAEAQQEICRYSQDHDIILETASSLKLELDARQKQINLLKAHLRKVKKDLEDSDQKRLYLEDKFKRLTELTEYVIVEKEIAEERIEQLELEVEETKNVCEKIEIELEIRKEEMEIQCIDDVPAKHYVKYLENENRIMKNALLKLKEYYFDQKNAILKAKDTVNEKVKEIDGLRITQDKLSSSISCRDEEIEELYRAIDDVMNADEIVLDVVVRNLKYEDHVQELYHDLYFMEDELYVSKELEDILQEIMFDDRERMEELLFKIQRQKALIESKTQLLADYKITIRKFRSLTAELQDSNLAMSAALDRLSQEKKNAVEEAEKLKLKVDINFKKSLKSQIQETIFKIDLELSTEQLNYLVCYLPESILGKDGLYDAVQSKVLLHKLIKKLNLLAEQINLNLFTNSDTNQIACDLQLIVFGSKFLIKLYELDNILKKWCMTIDRKESIFVELGKALDILVLENSQLDKYLESLYNKEFDRNANLKNIEGSLRLFSRLCDSQSSCGFDGVLCSIDCGLKRIVIVCKCLQVFYSEILKYNSESNICSTIVKMKKETEIIMENITLIIKLLGNENYKILVNLGSVKQFMLVAKSMEDVMKTFILMNEIIPDKEMYVVNSVVGEYDLNSIFKSLNRNSAVIKFFRKSVQNSRNVFECPSSSNQITPVLSTAQKLKEDQKNEMENLRKKMSNYEAELSKLSQELIATKLEKKSAKLLESKCLQTVPECLTVVPKCQVDCCPRVTLLKTKLCDMNTSLIWLNGKNLQMQSDILNKQLNYLIPLKMLPKLRYNPDVHTIFVLNTKLNKLKEYLQRIMMPCVVDITSRNKASKVWEKYLSSRMLAKWDIENLITHLNSEILNLKPFRGPNPFTYY